MAIDRNPIELALPGPAAFRRNRDRRGVSSPMGIESHQRIAHTPTVIDEAFANLSPYDDRISRVDTPATSNLNGRLLNQLSAQLKALDHQREQLAHLLRSIDHAGRTD
jgi:hypothetical protein